VGVLEICRDTDFVQEPFRTECSRHFGLQDLERDLAVVLEVLCQIDRSHPTGPEFPLDAVAVGQGGGEAWERIGHGNKR